MGLCLCRTAKHGDFEDGGNLFRVVNVNDDGEKICPGIMELTETALVFYIKRGGYVKWPYISILKYGYDLNLFSFVCGRRCQTGEGIFGFNCNRAEDLFNLLQICMRNNRISVTSETECETTMSERTLPYRYEAYPSFPATSFVLSSSQRPEPIGSELIPDPTFTGSSEESCTSTDDKQVKSQPICHLPLEKKISDGGVSQVSMHSSFEVEENCGVRAYSASLFRNIIQKEDFETLDSIHSGDLNGAIWDTGYDSDERRETSCIRRMGYENVMAIPKDCVRSRSMMVSISSSDSQSTNFIPTRIPPGCFFSHPSSPSLFEEKCSSEMKIPHMNDRNLSCNAVKPYSSGRDSMIREDCVPTYFNFDVRQTTQDSKPLNYIQVEMESGCDSDNPQTPQSTDSSLIGTTGHQSEFYTELDLKKTAALSLMQKQRPKDDGTRKTRHNSKYFPF
ncbi:fibroblast growth factor receptor substrate 2-like [Mixophyes fleayi]|uniref:fibroblast growth factor receptor substrate 2-like n=1 Tax=Mixophyes fleayi TaxID=3061075 RepID=UPI003F4DC325